MNVWPRQNAHFDHLLQRRKKMTLNIPSQKTGRNAFSYEWKKQVQKATFIKHCFLSVGTRVRTKRIENSNKSRPRFVGDIRSFFTFLKKPSKRDEPFIL